MEVNERGDRLVCASYVGGKIAYYSINDNGSITPINYCQLMEPKSGLGPDRNGRQNKIHAHHAAWSGNDAVLVSDLGCDVIQ